MTYLQNWPPGSLGRALTYVPQPLNFGTSGRRGKVSDLTQLEIYLNARAELDYLLDLPLARGGIRPSHDFYFAHDLRPSSTRFVAEHGGRGELAQAIECAIREAGLRPVNLGEIPTPALTAWALAAGCGSMMITGSHIPFDRNGYKTNGARGELLKADEAPVNERAARWRTQLLSAPCADARFTPAGNLKEGHRTLLAPVADGRAGYLQRYRDFFGTQALRGLRILVYQHSAVGRDLLPEMLIQLGAEVLPVGRSETFIPIDTEAIDESTLATMENYAREACRVHGRFDALISSDGDTDRPLIVGLDYATGTEPKARFFGGDLVGMIVADYLDVDAAVVPISCNDAIDRGTLAAVLEPKTRIGSPYVIAGMQQAVQRGRSRVCGWEANGGFLTGSAITRGGRTLSALPTRDAFLPILCLLARMKETGQSLSAVFDALPHRYSSAGLLRQFPQAASQQIIDALTSPDASLAALAQFFSRAAGFGAAIAMDTTDGVRISFDNGDVAHVRPSGNADELRIYAVADLQQRADEIVARAIAEPAGILRQLAEAFIATNSGQV